MGTLGVQETGVYIWVKLKGYFGEDVLKAHTFSMYGNEEKGDKLGVNSRLPGGCSGWRLRLSKAQLN